MTKGGIQLLAVRRRLDATPTWLGLGLGGLAGLALAWGALGPGARLGAWAAGLLALGLAGLAFGLGARVRLAADGLPARRVPAAPPPRPVLPPVPADGRAELVEPVEPPDPDPLIDMVPLPGGTFWMGSDRRRDPSAYDDELTGRQVRVSPFLIARTLVTRGLWRQIMAQAPKPWRRPVPDAWPTGDDRLPATELDWFDAVAFCNALSLISGLRPCYLDSGYGYEWTCDWQADGYRLPTEAEWEYACRGGSETRWSWGDNDHGADAHAWYSGNSGYRLHAVGEKAANPFGLYDMAGNCWEWCWDLHAGQYDSTQTEDPHGPSQRRLRAVRAVRGGSFVEQPRVLRSAFRFRYDPTNRNGNLGFRCVRSAPRSLVP